MRSRQTPVFRQWLKNLDYVVAIIIFCSIEKLEKGNFSNCKSTGNGIHKQKINFQIRI